MNVIAIDPGLNGAGAVSDERGDFIACFDLPMIGEGAQRRVDAANLPDLIREHGPYAFAIVEQVGARPGRGVRQCSGSATAHANSGHSPTERRTGQIDPLPLINGTCAHAGSSFHTSPKSRFRPL